MFQILFPLWSTSVLIQFPEYCRQSSKEANFSKSLDWFQRECLLFKLISMESDLCRSQTCSNFITLTWRLLWKGVRKMAGEMENNQRPFKIKNKSKFLDVYYRLYKVKYRLDLYFYTNTSLIICIVLFWICFTKTIEILMLIALQNLKLFHKNQLKNVIMW